MQHNHILAGAIALLLFAANGSASAQNTSGAPIPEQPTFDKSDPARHGQQLAEYSDIYDQGWKDGVNQGLMTLFNAEGDSVRRSFTRMVMEQAETGDKLITKFLSPAEIKGVAVLTHENPGSSDDNWLYLPSNKRVRRISGANNTASFQGTEFTYEDLSSLDPQEYEWRFRQEQDLERDGKQLPVYKLHAKPTYKDTGYSHIIVYLHRDNWRQERIEYYDKAGQLLKTREAGQWSLHHGRFWRAQTIEMTNHQTGKRTRLEVKKDFLNMSLYKSKKTGKARPNLSADLFTTRSIQG
jgi:hypothetical protein